METYKVTFNQNKPESAEKINIGLYRDTRKISYTGETPMVEWLIVCCEDGMCPLQMANKIATASYANIVRPQ